MNAGELLTYLSIGLLVLVLMLIIGILLRRRKKAVLIIISLIAIVYIGLYFYDPVYKAKTHQQNYEQMVHYLKMQDPAHLYEVSPKIYEAGVYVGEFTVHRQGNPNFGSLFQVSREGEVFEKGSWYDIPHPTGEEELWEHLIFSFYEGFQKELPQIVKKDQWLEGEEAVFALTVDNKPALASFHYDQASLSQQPTEIAEDKDFVVLEKAQKLFVYASETLVEEELSLLLENGETLNVDVAGKKGRLIVLERES